MDRVQRNGGTAGLVEGVLLAILFLMIFALGRDAMAPDPTKSLAAVTQKWGLFAAINFVGLLATGVAVPFLVGVVSRLREPAPTRARAALYVTLLGLAGYAAGSLIMWLGGHQIVEHATKDQAAATTAWLALTAVQRGLSAFGTLFTAAGTLIAGWAILSTGAMGKGPGWVAAVGGALGVLSLFTPSMPFFVLGNFLLIIVWDFWAGSDLRRAPAR